MPDLDFEFYAGGIEDGIIQLLTPMKQAPLKVRELTTYSGQLDGDAIKDALAADARLFPLVMVSYTGGENAANPPIPQVLGRPIHFLHTCGFVVIVADDNPQGERERRRSKIYAMIAAVYEALSGVRLQKTVEAEQVLLNTMPLTPTTNEYIERLPDLTAYAVHFETAFKWSSPDRTAEPIDVVSLDIEVNSMNEAGKRRVPPELPGVHVEH